MNDESLFRSAPGFSLRAAQDDDEQMPVMVVNFARFGEWTEIRSFFEGNFMERFAHGAFAKTIKEQIASIRSLYQHGRDPQIGMKPLGTITDLREERDGGWAEVQLLDTAYVRELIPGLEQGLYGASFQFRPVRQEIVEKPERSDTNPDGLPEVTVTEAMLREVGPVTWGQYEHATATIRSLTDDMFLEQVMREHPDRVRDLLNQTSSDRTPDGTVSSTSADDQTPDEPSTSGLEIARLRLLLSQRRFPASLTG